MKKSSIVILILALFLGAGVFAAVKSTYKVIPEKCIGCKLCVDSCPTKAIAMKNNKAVIDPEKCVNCGICAGKCPVKAIEPPKDKKQALDEEDKPEHQTKKVYIADTRKCTGCKECVPTCPVKAISVSYGKVSIDPEKCINCGLCANSCAFNALKPSDIKIK
ncbi:MAG TPA: 4Fe-4S binding protein [bacterium]|jgi:electron transport complex protein RnfB|nr:4Fe-4S binding protein [bacterium]HPM47733.1 4Fe-4S binding protein [bacterium]HPV21759.1 4Fe-4S binding protein [bacterium]HQI06184.1 4Fe-4S binding protein [bacterium]HRQ71095.1 4Fe-4S binding protein [bacterium]